MEFENVADTSLAQGQFAPGELDFAKLQLQQAIDTYRAQITLLLQALTVLVVADCTVIGLALTNKLPVVMMVTPAFPLLMLYGIELAGRLSVPILYSALNIEHRYRLPGVDGMVSTFLAFISSPDYVQELREIVRAEGSGGFKERMSRLHTLPRPQLTGYRGLGKRALRLAAASQLAAGPLLYFVAGWSMFGK
jgi:hypothetical protein